MSLANGMKTNGLLLENHAALLAAAVDPGVGNTVALPKLDDPGAHLWLFLQENLEDENLVRGGGVARR